MEHSTVFMAFGAILVLFSLSDAYPERGERGIDEALGLECIPLGGKCKNMFYSCCKQTVCYREEGFKFNSGVCVRCIQEGQKCQKNSQCCTYLKCQKPHAFSQGVCGPEKADGEKCYQNSQCRGYCDKKFSWWPSGKCASYV